MDKKRKVVVKRSFRDNLKRIFEFIRGQSVSNAEKFKDGIKPKLEEIEKHPEAHPKIQGLENKDGEYRSAKYMKSFKIIYYLEETLLSFLGIIHQKQDTQATKDLVEKNEDDKK